jgi:hypothetical protein
MTGRWGGGRGDGAPLGGGQGPRRRWAGGNGTARRWLVGAGGAPAIGVTGEVPAKGQPETVTSCHSPPFRLRLLPLAWPGEVSLT